MRMHNFLFLAMTTAQLRIADTIDQFYDESSPYAQEGARYKEVSKYLDEEARNQMARSHILQFIFRSRIKITVKLCWNHWQSSTTSFPKSTRSSSVVRKSF